MYGARQILLLQEGVAGVLRWRRETLHTVDTLLEQAVGSLLQRRFIDSEGLRQPLPGHMRSGRFGTDQLEIAEGDGVEDDTDPALGP